MFYQPSTRTRWSFETASLRLGAKVVSTESAGEFSSAAKGESLQDTIKVLKGYYPDVIVLRHPETGAAARAAAVSNVPIINAGDGPGQHPTQALLDVYTIRSKFGQIDGLTVVMMGDLKNGRTIRSLAYLLTKFDHVRMIFVSPQHLALGRDIAEWLKGKRVDFTETNDLHWALRQSPNVVYATRTQIEYGSELSEGATRSFSIGTEELEILPRNAIIMHPLPRNAEISTEVDTDIRAAYFTQAWYGVPLRMAVILYALGRI